MSSFQSLSRQLIGGICAAALSRILRHEPKSRPAPMEFE